MTTITDAALAEAEQIVEGFNTGLLKEHSLAYHLYQAPAYVVLPTEVEAAFQHAAEAHRIWMVAESPEGGRDVPDTDPLTHAETCRALLDEALAGLINAVNAHTAARDANRSAA